MVLWKKASPYLNQDAFLFGRVCTESYDTAPTVKNSYKLHTVTWTDLTGTMLKDLSAMKMPHTTGVRSPSAKTGKTQQWQGNLEIQAGVIFGCSPGGLGKQEGSSVLLVICYFSRVLVT